MAISYPIVLPATAPAQMEWGALNAGGQNVSPYALSQETFEWPGNRWRVSVQYPKLLRAQADAIAAALTSLYGVGTLALGPYGAGKTAKGKAAGVTAKAGLVNWAMTAGSKFLTLAYLNRKAEYSASDVVLKAGDYIQIPKNYLSQTRNLSAAPWLPFNSGGVGDPVVTGHNQTAPDGTANAADTIAFPASTAGNETLWLQATAVDANLALQTFKGQIWLKAPTPGQVNLGIEFWNDVLGATAGTLAALNVTASWDVYEVGPFVAPAGTNYLKFTLGLANAMPAITVYAYGAALYTLTKDARLHLITQDGISSSVGGGYPGVLDNLNVEIWPRLREVPTLDVPYIIDSPQGIFRLASFEPKWTIDTGYVYGLTFEAEEAF